MRKREHLTKHSRNGRVQQLGKTEFLATQLNRKRCIILDATLSTEEGAKIKLKKIIKVGKIPIIYAVIPDDLKRAFIAFLNRDRKFSDAHFYKTHSGCRKTLLWITLNYPMVKVNIIESSYTKNQLRFAKVEFDTQKQLTDYLISLQFNRIVSSKTNPNSIMFGYDQKE